MKTIRSEERFSRKAAKAAKQEVRTGGGMLYQYSLRFIHPRPFPTLEETRVVLDELQRPQAKPENFVDLSLMQELEKEKFFDKLK